MKQEEKLLVMHAGPMQWVHLACGPWAGPWEVVTTKLFRSPSVGYTVSSAAMVAGTSLFLAHRHCTTRPFTLRRPLHPSHTCAAALARASAGHEPEVVIVGAGAPHAITSWMIINCYWLSQKSGP